MKLKKYPFNRARANEMMKKNSDFFIGSIDGKKQWNIKKS